MRTCRDRGESSAGRFENLSVCVSARKLICAWPYLLSARTSTNICTSNTALTYYNFAVIMAMTIMSMATEMTKIELPRMTLDLKHLRIYIDLRTMWLYGVGWLVRMHTYDYAGTLLRYRLAFLYYMER